MATTVIELPTGNLIEPNTVKFTLDITGEQHDSLIMSTSSYFERAMADVVDQNLDGTDAYGLPLMVVGTLFMQARAYTFGPEVKADWNCKKMIERPSADGKKVVKGECGFTNTFVENISKLGYIEIPKDQKSYKRREVELADGEKIQMYSRYLTTREEFEILDFFYNQGVSKNELFSSEEHVFKYFKRRWLTSLIIDHDKYRTLNSPEEKASFISDKKVSAKVISEMYQDLKMLDSVGYDLKPKKVVCKECGAATLLQLPFSVGLLV